MMNLHTRIVGYFAVVAAALLMHATPAAAGDCQTLYAGKTINVGTVCVTNDADYLTVTYTTVGGWTLDETHLFVGESKTGIPQTQTGNPKVGHFPYTTNSEGSTQVFKLPLKDFGVVCPGTTKELTLAAHAVVRSGTRTETAWGNGTRLTAKGNWAMYFTYVPVCPVIQEPKTCAAPETAFGRNADSQTFAEIGLTNERTNKEGRWGWQMTVNGNGTAELWAGAGQNDTSKGTLVGSVYYYYYNGVLDLTFQVASGYGLMGTHVYAGDTNATTIAPGKYGNSKDGGGYGSVTYNGIPVVDTAGDGILVIAHAEVCGIR